MMPVMMVPLWDTSEYFLIPSFHIIILLHKVLFLITFIVGKKKLQAI